MSVQVTVADIYNRSRCQMEEKEYASFADVGGLFYEANSLIETGAFSTSDKLPLKEKSLLQDIIYKLESVSAADSYYDSCLNLINSLSIKNEVAAKFFAEKFCSDVVPYMRQNLEALAYAAENYSDISPKIVNEITEAANKQSVIHRILNNHKSIDNKFNLMEAINKLMNKDVSVIAETCAYYINQYDIDTYKKFNIAIEEMCYLSALNNPEMFDKSVRYLKEYFMLSNTMTEKELKYMRKVVRESYVIPDDLKKNLIKSDLVQEKLSIFSNNVQTDEMIDNLKTSYTRSIDDLYNIVNNFLEKDDILRGLEELLVFIFKATICGTFVSDKSATTIANDVLLYLTDKIKCMITDEMYGRPLLTREELYVIINIYQSLEDEIAQKYIRVDTPFKDTANDFCGILRICSDSLSEARDLAIPKYKIQEDLSSEKTYTEAEYSTYRFNRLLSLAENISNSLNGSIFDKNNKDMYSYMGEDNKIDITLAQNEFDGEDDDDYIEAEAEAVKFCKYTNETLSVNGESDTIKVYYEMIGNIVEYHLIETAAIIIDENNLDKYTESVMDNSMDLYISIFESLDEFVNIIEENEDKQGELLEAFAEGFYSEAITEANKAPKKPVKLDSDLKDDTAEKKGKFSLNNLKLAMMGLRGKMKKMGQKEREVSRTIDNYSKLFVKSLQKALVSDRREAIIKGSVIPSFSKLIKLAFGIGVIGIGAGAFGGLGVGVAVAATTALGGFAVSKRLTKKERTLLLDEIEIELEIIDKEIARADSKDQIKKMRVLMREKKELQRQYQRIRYNIRVGKDILPGSGVGIPARE